MKTFRTELTHTHPSCDHLMWIAYGETEQEARFRMRQLVHRWAVATGNPWPTGNVRIDELTEPSPDTPFPTPKADSSPDCTDARSSDGSTSNGGH